MLDGEADGGAEGGDGMGKLIDSDIVKEYLKRAIFGADVKIDGWVDAMPAADAVPVTWLREKMEEPRMTCANPFGFVLDEWLEERKEKQS